MRHEKSPHMTEAEALLGAAVQAVIGRHGPVITGFTLLAIIASPNALACIDELINAEHADVNTVRELVKIRNAIGRFADAVTAAADAMGTTSPPT